ncbi:MAG: nitroreductase family protein [Bacteroidales bacterium]|jgi:nitroreductase|nr:nitroreductase family protein [Bacteroidales bacterium]
MELYEGLISRRSIRRYTGKKIDEEKIEAILKAGMYAPSARNRRPWHFIVIDDRKVMSRIMEMHPYASMLSEASHAIVVCGDQKLENGPGYYKLDCSAASQNILLAAHSLGLGAVWLGVEPRQERIEGISKLMGLPPHIIPLSIISLGIPVKIPVEIPDRYEPEKIRRNRW